MYWKLLHDFKTLQDSSSIAFLFSITDLFLNSARLLVVLRLQMKRRLPNLTAVNPGILHVFSFLRFQIANRNDLAVSPWSLPLK